MKGEPVRTRQGGELRDAGASPYSPTAPVGRLLDRDDTAARRAMARGAQQRLDIACRENTGWGFNRAKLRSCKRGSTCRLRAEDMRI